MLERPRHVYPIAHTLRMYSTEYQITERCASRPKGEVCFLASWVLVGRPNLVQKAQVNGGKPTDCDTNCKLLRFIYLLTLSRNDIAFIVDMSDHLCRLPCSQPRGWRSGTCSAGAKS